MASRKRYILWLIFLRLVIVTSLVVSAFIIQSITPVFLPLSPFYYLILIFYLLSFIYFVLYLWGKYYSAQVYFQIFLDLILITALVYISGGLKGSFYFLYIFEIIAASIVLSKRATYVTASLSSIFFGLLVELMYFGRIPYFGPEKSMEISLGLVTNNIFIAWSAFYLVAFLMNYLTGSLQRTKDQLRLAQKELEVKDRLAVAGEVSAQLAHEVRNPLAAISGSVQVLKDELYLTGEQKELMTIIVDESRRVSRSIEQFLNLASPTPNVFSSINLSAVLKETLMLLQGGGELNGNLQVKGNFKSKNVYYFGNNNQFKQLFWNLIKNAAKAMHKEGGELTIDFNQEKKDEIQLKIVDTGIGMTKEEEEKIFDPFYSGFKNGRGLGLSVVRRIVDTYKGNIKVDSEPNKGTEITITLPVGEREKLGMK
ncbi:MAG: GHKL domain-containing protein [Candidatus Aminicenantes bacterium]|nr:GHKL domain-containing protein [Candidatus Aminicenantes bacterium]